MDLTDHMDSFLLASQRLTRSGQRETDYRYFELFLETVSGFPSVSACMAGYYTTYPAILQQSLATKDSPPLLPPCFLSLPTLPTPHHVIPSNQKDKKRQRHETTPTRPFPHSCLCPSLLRPC